VPIPLEVVVLLVAFAERGIGTYSPLGIGTGSVVLMIISAIVLAWRVWPRRPKALVPA
jgi:lipopolysaccharide export system permease protein